MSGIGFSATRIIGFRGIDIDTGRFVYAPLGAICWNPDTRLYECVIPDEKTLRSVDPASITQLVGYDADGSEVYEGDICVYPDGSEFTAEIFTYPKTINASKLKGGFKYEPTD